jgi:hypothetical protein
MLEVLKRVDGDIVVYGEHEEDNGEEGGCSLGLCIIRPQNRALPPPWASCVLSLFLLKEAILEGGGYLGCTVRI